jgi:serine/threonine protein phosphatase 1
MVNRTLPRTPPQTPPGQRIYVVGDIHGRDDLLERLHGMIKADLAACPATGPIVVYLGDYVDRGPASYEVIDRLLNDPLTGCRVVHLLGNHEAMMLEFLDHGEDLWLFNGGSETLTSYGLRGTDPWSGYYNLPHLQEQLRSLLPDSHLRFLRGLAPSFTCGDYFFVHAGIRPGRPLDAQTPRDLIWIREPFLTSRADFGKCVVHGHSISPAPELLDNRIGIDTGAFFTGRLTCLVLQDREQRLLQT